MIRAGDVVRCGSGPPLKVALIFQDMALCLWVDRRGRVRREFHYLGDLIPFIGTLGPRSLWPPTTDLPIGETRRVSAGAHRPAAAGVRKPRPSRKIHRRKKMSDVDRTLTQIEEWRSGRLWGAPEIAKFAGVSEDTVARWATLPDCPINKVAGGRFFVTRAALMTWLTAKDCA